MQREVFCVLIVICVFVCMSCSKEEGEEDERKMTVGVFGGSVSSTVESEVAKDLWRSSLGVIVKTYGIGGAGFSNTTANCVPKQIQDAPVCDVYVLWASTNDFKQGMVGEITSSDLSTQSGGIRESVYIIKKKAPRSRILFFVSMYRFDSLYKKMIPFIEAQKEICILLKIPYLDQSCFFDSGTYLPYFYEDRVHLNREGYRKIAYKQVEFLNENIISR